MPNKYPGGYTIIDLGGVNITDDVITIDGLYERIATSDKPVRLTNFLIFGTEPSFPQLWILSLYYGTGNFAYAIPNTAPSDANLSSMHIEEGGSGDGFILIESDDSVSLVEV